MGDLLMGRSASFFKSEVLEVLGECTHNGDLDLDEFCNKITGVWAAAQVDGVEAQEFEELVADFAPEAITHLKLATYRAA